MKKLNFSINFKKEENSSINDENYKEILKIVEKMNIAQTLKNSYNRIISEKTREMINLKDIHFENLNRNKTKVFDQFFCWEIYKYFFDLIAKVYFDPFYNNIE